MAVPQGVLSHPTPISSPAIVKVSSTAAWIPGFILILLSALPGSAQQSADTVVVRPGRDYAAGRFHRWLLGDGYRHLWSLEVPVPVLDLDTVGGGLAPVSVDSVLGARVLRLSSADGPEYEFIPVDFEARIGLDPELRTSLAGEVVQDLVSSTLPLSGLVLSRLLEASGMSDADRDVGLMPDDPVLGDFGDRFGGVVGQLRPLPAESAAGTDPGRRPLHSPELLERLQSDPDALVDQRAFLKARLFDLLVGDWNRHPEQWAWIGRPEESDGREIRRFAPLPGPRLWAFSRLDGLIQTIASLQYPHFVGYSGEYPSVEAVSLATHGLDRRLLTALDSIDFSEVADDLVATLADAVVEEAFDRLPDKYRDRAGAELQSIFIRRRDHLPGFASRYYRLLARWVDVDGTDAPDLVRIDRRADGTTSVTIHAVRGSVTNSRPWYHRTFHPSHTEEVRIRTLGGDDRVEISGTVSEAPIGLRVLGGDGNDRFEDDTSGRGLWIHDSDGSDAFDLGPEATLDRSDWSDSDDPRSALRGTPRRDWGIEWSTRPTVGANPDDGLVAGVTMTRFGYGFRHDPWKDRLDLRTSIGTGTWRPNLGLTYRTRPLSRSSASSLRGEVRMDWRGARADRFHGFGNDTDAPADDDRYRAWRSELSLAGGLRLDPTDRTGFTLGVGYHRFAPQANEGTLVSEVDPYGYGSFEHLEAVATVSWDHRDDPIRPRTGYRLALAAAVVPPELDVTDAYGVLSGVSSTYLDLPAIPLEPTLAVRVIAERVLGAAPYFAYASVGGDRALRGFRRQRYLGDAALAATVELRGQVAEFTSVFPGEVGLLGLVDTGRVWFDGASPGSWHAGVGGGVWAGLLDEYALSLTVAKGERWGVYFAFGMPF